MPQCLHDGCLRFTRDSRCAEHSRRLHYQGGWTKFAREWLDEWASRNGPVCVGWQRDPHAVTRRDLTLDHVVARSGVAGYQALCRPCNGAKGDRDAVEGTELRR